MDAIHVFARAELVPSRIAAEIPALLLEGCWPPSADSARRFSLDEAIDARREYIDVAASRWTSQLAAGCRHAAANPPTTALFAYLNALRLRYWFVKLLRVIAFFDDVLPAAAGKRIILHAATPRDDDYIALMAELCGRKGAILEQHLTRSSETASHRIPRNRTWRRLAGRLLAAHAERQVTSHGGVVLCGNPAILDPVCRELVERHVPSWWLYDRFSVGCWRRWARRGVGQLVCNGSVGRARNVETREPIEPLRFHDIELTAIVERWLGRCIAQHGAYQTRLIEAITSHFERVRPQRLVVDEDATPFARAAVWVARQCDIPAFVVQHGAPYVRFGFVPPVADRLLVWGQATRRQLARWEVPGDRIEVVGCPKHESFDPPGVAAKPLDRPPSVLVLDTVPARDERPDAVGFHLTRRTHREMLRAACAAVIRCGAVRLEVRLHPRRPDRALWDDVRREFPALRVRFARRQELLSLAAEADCVLSCASSSGVEAMLTGTPVIQLLPSGSADVLAQSDWGFFGTARSEAELVPLLRSALCGEAPRQLAGRQVFAALGRSAAARIVDALQRGERDTAVASSPPMRKASHAMVAS